MFKLVIQDDEGKTTVVPVIRDEITVGRKEGNTIRLTERNVSRRHARIVRTNGTVAIEDLDSYNGIRVNGTRIQGRCNIKESDRVQIGDYLIELKSEVEGAHSEQETQRVERVDAGIDPMGKTPAPDLSQPATVPIPRPAANPGGNGAVNARQRALADTDPHAAAAPRREPVAPVVEETTPARLVILSTNFAGREFPLDKPALVVGRTDDNDIWVNHRSISRHHAKIVHENGRYAIVDLQSSNGVRVNGEEYGKVELRRGDTIDLGHVRLRFVEPGEDFVFGRDAQAVDVESGGGRRALWALLAVLVLGSVAVALFVSHSGSAGGTTATADSGHQAGAGHSAAKLATAAPTSKSDAGSAAHTNAATTAESQIGKLHSLLDSADKAIAAEQWTAAQAAAGKALAIDSSNAHAQAVQKQAGQELDSEKHYQAFEKAARHSDFHTAALQFRQIAPESVYRVKGQADYERTRSAYENVVSRRARRLAHEGKCQALRQLATTANALWPQAGAAASRYPCRHAVAISHGKTHRTTGHNKRNASTAGAGTSGSGHAAGGSQGSGKSVTELVSESKDAAKAGQFGRALRLCEDALRKRHGDGEALMVCAISACNLKNAGKAKHYSAQIHGDKKGFVRQICLRNGVDLQ